MEKFRLSYRQAVEADLGRVLELLHQDELRANREQLSKQIDPRYKIAFGKIAEDPNQFLMVVMLDEKIVGTCQLTLIPSLSFTGSTRLQIESVRVAAECRGQGIGEWMLVQAIEYGRAKGALIAQLSTNKQRGRAKRFYEKLGFDASHEGMKLYLSNC